MKMLCCHDESGRITNMIFEPIPDGFEAHYDKIGVLYSLFDNPDNLTGLEVAQLCHVAAGEVVTRPAICATVEVDRRVVTLGNVPDSSTVTIAFNVGTSFEHREVITDHVFEVDEPGLVEVHIAPPWPMLEGKYAVEIQ